MATLPLLVALLCAAPAAGTPYQHELRDLAAQKGDEAGRLHRLFDLDWRYQNTEFPERATSRGYPGQNDRWTDDSMAAIARRKEESKTRLEAIRSIDRSKLDGKDQLNYDLFLRNARETVSLDRFPEELLAISQMGGPQYSSRVFEVAPGNGVQDYEDMLKRLARLPQHLAQVQELLRLGAATGITQPRVVLRDVPKQLQAQTPPDPLQSPLLERFTKFPGSISAAEQARLRGEAVRIFQEQVAPAFVRLGTFFVQQYLPRAREIVSIEALPQGDAWYAARVERETTTDLTPQQIHALGLSEVTRIRGELQQVMTQAGFDGGFAAFSQFLREDPRFFFTDADSLVLAYRGIAKRIDPELPRIIGKLPRLTYGVKEIPAFSAPSQTTAYYQQGSPQAHRAGTFYVNTYDLRTRPKWEMEALTLHESVPGHHLQIALAQEQEGVPRFRQEGHYTAFVEGWGLYAESLGSELGLFTDPYAKYGQLTYEMWRAVRLVVDTGMHAMGWTRQQAIDFFRQNSAKTDHDITVEIDRYIVWPGQALAYKIGELKIKELRRLAERELGAQFDERGFHDAVLGNGAVPLDVLDRQVRAWIAREKPAPAR